MSYNSDFLQRLHAMSTRRFETKFDNRLIVTSFFLRAHPRTYDSR